MPLRSLVQNTGYEQYPLTNDPLFSGGYNYSESETYAFEQRSFRQRSFKFGDGTTFDRPGEGFSREPLIGRNIDLPGVEEQPNKTLGVVDALTDGLIRGGINTAVSRTAKDVARIAKFYITNRGIGFILKQVGLQRTNPVIRKLSVDTSSAGGVINSLGEGLTNLGGSNSNQRVYNLGVNTLAQVAGNAFGLHIKREGLLPTSYEGYIDDLTDDKTFNNPVSEYNENTGFGNLSQNTNPLGKGNRLINLFGGHILNLMSNSTDSPLNIPGLDSLQQVVQDNVGDVGGLEAIEDIGGELSGFKKFLGGGEGFGRKELYDYSGGPNSLYGLIGNTTIYKAGTTFNNAGKIELGGVEFKLTDGNPYLTSQTGYIPKGNYVIYPGTIKEVPVTETVTIEYEPTLASKYGKDVEEVEVDTTTTVVEGKEEYATVGGRWNHPLYETEIKGKPDLETKKGLRGGQNLLLQKGGTEEDGRLVAPENKVKLLRENPEDQSDNFIYPTINLSNIGDFRLHGRNVDMSKASINSKFKNITQKTGQYPNHANVGKYGLTTATGGNKPFYRETRIDLGNPGKNMVLDPKKNPGKNIFGVDTHSYDLYDPDTIDLLNGTDIFRNEDNKSDFGEVGRDLIKFRIEAMDGDNPFQSNVMVFRAYLDSWGDSYNGNWKSFKYNGRADDVYVYEGFKRTLGFSFKVAAQSRHEMMPMYRKLNYLVSQTAPEYVNGRMRGSFNRLTIGSLIDRTPGFFTSISLDWNKNYPWEIAINEPEQGEDKDGMLLMPHILDVKCAFQPIHNFIPQKSVTQSPFILPTHSGLSEQQKWYKHEAAKNEKVANPQTVFNNKLNAI